MLLVKVQFADNSTGYRTIGHLRSVNHSDKELFINYIIQRLGTLNDSYSVSEVSKIVFSYIIKEGTASDNRGLLKDTSNKEVKWHRFNNMNLPITMVPSEYGTILAKPSVYDTFSRYFAQSTTTKGVRIYQIDVFSTKNEVTILGGSELKWIDTTISGEGFVREIQKSTIYFLDGEVILRKQVLPAKPFTKGILDRKITNYFVTLDIETIKENGKLKPYLICAYNGYKSISSYGLNQEKLFRSFMTQLVKMIPPKALRLTAYAHNLSGFDGVFLMNQLVAFGEVDPLVFNGKIMSIKLNLNIEGYEGKTIIFKDSYLLLPVALRKLCELFKLNIAKTYFPFHLTDIYYKGPIPGIHLWDIDSSEYRAIAKRFTQRLWYFEHEAIRYCNIDCIALHQVITKFNEFIFEHFSVNVHSVLTLPALSMRIFKAMFMPLDTIYQLSGDVEKAIRESYTGGAVDVYIPHNRLTDWLSNENVQHELIYHGSEINIAIASAITSYARIHMSQFKNNPEFKLYYTDTDSTFVNKPLPAELVGNELGQMKLENIIKKAVFLAPKVYALITEDGKEIIKVKGLTKDVTNKLHFNDLEALLIKDVTREFSQEKWFKSVLAGEISTSDIIYTLKTTSNKRLPIYENGVFNNTKPYHYDNIQSKNKVNKD